MLKYTFQENLIKSGERRTWDIVNRNNRACCKVSTIPEKSETKTWKAKHVDFFSPQIYIHLKNTLSIVQYLIYILEATITSMFLLKYWMRNLQPKAVGQVTNLRDLFTLLFLKCILCCIFHYKFLDSKCVIEK